MLLHPLAPKAQRIKELFTLDLAGAYPVEAAVISWTRKLSLYRQRNILYFSETYILKEYKAPSSIILMTAALVEKERRRNLIIEIK